MTEKDKLLKDRRVETRVAGEKIWARVVKWVTLKPKTRKRTRRLRKRARVMRGLANAKPRNWHRVLRQKGKRAKMARRAHR